MRIILLALGAMLVLLDATAETPAGVITACTKTVHNYALSRDALDADAYAEVFTHDGVFATPGPVHAGREALKNYIHSQAADRQTMHHVTTVQITPTGTTTATGIVYVIVQFSARTEQGSAVLERIANAVYQDTYALADGVCRIRHRTLKIVMDTKLPTH